MNSIGEIITKHRKKMGMSQVELAKELCNYGYSYTNKSISSWEKGGSELSSSVLLLLCKLLNITDLYGEYYGNNPYNPLSSLNDIGKEKALEYIELLETSDKYKAEESLVIPFRRTLRLFNLPASAGTGNFLDGEDYTMIEVGEEVPDNADFGIRISGDSMEPQFVNGQIVWVHQQNNLETNEIGIFFLDGNAYCKKLRKDNSGLFLISLNKKYSPIAITSASNFQVFGKVVG